MHKWLIVIMLISLTGCAQQQRIEKLGMSDIVAFDPAYEENGKPSNTQLSIAISVPKTGKMNNTQLDILQTKADSPKEARSNFNRQIDKVIVSGQLRSMIFGKELAKQGIWRALDSYRRDYSVGEQLNIVVVNGSAVDMLTHSHTQIQSVGNYIDQLLTQQSDIHEVPNTTLYSFARDYFDDGIDPIAPMIMLKNDHVEIEGVALFKKDRYIGKLNQDKAAMFAILHQNLKDAEFDIKFMDQSSGQKEGAMINSIISKRKVSVLKHDAGSSPQIVIHIQLSGIILEYTGTATFKEAAEQTALNQSLSVAIREQLQAIVDQVQRTGGDNLGFGTYVRNSMSYEEWEKFDWNARYPSAEIRVEVDASIRDFGMIL
ncbi:Ger(x)C family spore germination protein [Paenibacillus sp. CGMCC 1.16610]|uniref:Ger(X)C family spore germination protein n=1 Tax=Paenibacillus anseongense TaxID=2682845 RepID=A0ABW9UBY3_9BACL|nr:MULTISPECIES: Ger(x)C family spore germination protein [Paenibacillus]MBA2942057.1 Ger(x)C family spore germination protein [Paenibacillus sp. CGMCC 1.16610]MVQ35890.1 Ger(x)C family spore germination protein [Paenibacillus anseongense]